MVDTSAYFGPHGRATCPNSIRMTDLDVMLYLGYACGYGVLMGILWSTLLFYWRRGTM